MKHITLLIFVVCCQISMAQTSLSLEQCRSKAVEYNKELKKARLQQQEVSAQQKVARTAYLPSVEFSSNLIYSPDLEKIEIPATALPTAESVQAAQSGDFSGTVYIPGMSTDLEQLTVLYGGISVMQPIYAGGKIRIANKQADIGIEMAQYGVELKEDEIIAKTDNAFWTLATIQSNRKVAVKYIEMLSELEEKLTLMFETGLIPASEKLKVSVQKNNAELELLKADNGIKLAKMYLNQLIGQNLSTDIQLNYKKEAISMTSPIDIKNALTQRKELKALERKVSFSKLDKKMAQADYLPELGVGIQYNGFYANDITDDVSYRPMVAAQLTIPIFKWGQGNKKQKAANFKIKQAEMELSNTAELLSLEIQQAQIKLQEAQKAITIAQKNIAQAEESLAETQASFDVGLNTTSDLLDAQAQWLKANTQLFSAYAQYRIQQTEVNRVTGKL